MREIKFRGKVSEDVYDHYASQEPKFKKGTFVYGSLLVEREECGCITKVFIVDQHKGCRVEVDPETVGQYTGLKDKNGEEIYEGDAFITNAGVVAVVEWEKEGRFLGFTADSEKKIVYINREPAVEIIGNIQDNPEMTEEGR